MLTSGELGTALRDLPGERVTQAMIDARIVDRNFYRLDPDETLLICVITLDNGFTVTGESACVDPENFDRQIGEKIAFDKAYDKLWPLFGFLLAEARYRRDAEQER